MNGWVKKRSPVGAVAVVFLAGLLAGCIGDDGLDSDPGVQYVDDPVEGLVIEHEAGNTYEAKSTFLVDQARRCGLAGTTIGSVCKEAYPVLDEVPEAGLVPAPYADITEVTFAETSTDLIVTMQISDLDEEWQGLVNKGGQSGLSYSVCWDLPQWDDEGEVEAGGCVGLFVQDSRAEPILSSFYFDITQDCNDWWICSFDVPMDIQYGQPGVIQFSIPRPGMLYAQPDDEYTGIYFLTARQATASQLQFQIAEGPVHEWFGTRLPFSPPVERLDEGVTEETFTYQTPKAPWEKEELSADRFGVTEGASADATGQYRPDTDVLEMVVQETETTFTISSKMALVEEDPRPHWLEVYFGMPSQRVHMVGIYVEDDERRLWAIHDVPEGEKWRRINDPVSLEVIPGEPGWVNFTYDRKDLGSPMEGERLNMVWAWASPEEPLWIRGESFGPLTIDEARTFLGEYDWPTWGPLYWFVMDTAPANEEAHGTIIKDEEGDARLPDRTILDDTHEDQYDIIYAQVEGRDASTVHASLGVKDLSRVTVPTGYEAVIYAIGISTERGKDAMVFYYKDDDHQDFYCAPDTLLFNEEPVDPSQTVWSRIHGLLSHGGQTTGEFAAAAGGAISFHVPHECLGITDGELFQVNDLAGGTFLLENPVDLSQLGQVYKVDNVRTGPGDTPFWLGLETLADGEAVRPAWYVAPLGLEGQDWNILGVVLAVLLAAGGAIAVWAKRRKLRQYLARVDQATAIKDLTARETALGELRTLLRADLVAGQVSEGHYAVVMRHIDEAMKHVRVRSIEETFRELPFHIVSKLRSVLDDGVITQDEHEMVTDLIERAKIPDEDKQKVLSRLERWQLVDEVAKA